MTVGRTISGDTKCLAIYEANAFCVEILGPNLGDDERDKIEQALDAATRAFSVSKADLTTELGIHDYLGISLWDPKLSDMPLLAADTCWFRYDLIPGREFDCVPYVLESMQRMSGGTARAGGANLSTHSGFLIQAPAPTWKAYADLGDFDNQRNDFRRVLIHEYFHSYQQAHRLQLPQDAARVATWLTEGSAEYAATALAANLGWIDWEHSLRSRFQAIQHAIQEFPEFNLSMGETRESIGQIDRNVCPRCHIVIRYDLGFWATAFAVSISSPSAVVHDYWDALEDHSWQEALSSTTGSTIEEFYASFSSFIADHLAEESFGWLSLFPLPELRYG